MFRVALFAIVALLAGCGSINGTYPRSGALMPTMAIRLTETETLAASQIAAVAAVGAAIYIVYDPLAPNWEIEEARLAPDTFRLSMKMKRFHNGGDGEALRLLRRRAEQLQRENGYGGYQLVDFATGIDSSTPVARRYSEGTVRLVSLVSPPK